MRVGSREFRNALSDIVTDAWCESDIVEKLEFMRQLPNVTADIRASFVPKDPAEVTDDDGDRVQYYCTFLITEKMEELAFEFAHSMPFIVNNECQYLDAGPLPKSGVGIRIVECWSFDNKNEWYCKV